MKKLTTAFLSTFLFMTASYAELSGDVVRGTVLDESGAPVIGASVMIDGTKIATTTNDAGQFAVRGASADSKITISHLSYVPQTVSVTNSTNIKLTENQNTLETVVITGTPTSKALSIPLVSSDAPLLDATAGNAQVRASLDKDMARIADEKKSATAQPSKPIPKTDTAPSNQPQSVPAKLSDENANARIAELQKNANDMKTKEQSTAAKTVGAAAIGATGIGASQYFQGKSEQNADESAEASMKAYLETFRCDYGTGQQFRGGEQNITLPGGNALIKYYGEYQKIANELTVSKAELGLKPGIEAESVLDKANTGLYDNESIGKTGGGFTSLSRALSDPMGTDAAAWDAQKAESASRVKTGAIVAGSGIAAGLIGNTLISATQPRERSAEINADYAKKLQVIRETLAPVEQESRAQAEEPAAAEQDEDFRLPEDLKNPAAGENKLAVPAPQAVTAPTSLQIKMTPVTPVTEQEKPILTLYNISLFASGKYELTDAGKKTVQEALFDKMTTIIIAEGITDLSDYKFIVVGHTDSAQINPASNLCKVQKICNNDQLSQARAKAVAEFLSTQTTKAGVEHYGVGEKCATKTTNPKQRALDRKVEFYLYPKEEVFDIESVQCKAGDK